MTKLKKNKNNTFSLTIDNMTVGYVMALTRALKYYDSPVGNDVLAIVRNAIYSGDRDLYAEILVSLDQLEQAMEKQANKVVDNA